MRTDLIRIQIRRAWEDEGTTQEFGRLVRRQLADAGAGAVPEGSRTLREILDGWRTQLESVPDLIDAMRQAAERFGVTAGVEPVLRAAEGYFLDEQDVLPDSHGVIGLLDDVYLTLSLLQTVSECNRSQCGAPLIDADLHESIAAVRLLFRGERLAALDERIQGSLRSQDLTESIARLTTLAKVLIARACRDGVKAWRGGERRYFLVDWSCTGAAPDTSPLQTYAATLPCALNFTCSSLNEVSEPLGILPVAK
jgi:uncharacterized membrane protein YkvA (DUF1232 family)